MAAQGWGPAASWRCSSTSPGTACSQDSEEHLTSSPKGGPDAAAHPNELLDIHKPEEPDSQDARLDSGAEVLGSSLTGRTGGSSLASSLASPPLPSHPAKPHTDLAPGEPGWGAMGHVGHCTPPSAWTLGAPGPCWVGRGNPVPICGPVHGDTSGGPAPGAALSRVPVSAQGHWQRRAVAPAAMRTRMWRGCGGGRGGMCPLLLRGLCHTKCWRLKVPRGAWA